MTKLVCPYTRMIEPLRDGVLQLASRTTLEQHLDEGCRFCQAEIAYLDGLEHALQRSAPAVDRLALQRQRSTLLASAAQQGGHPRGRWQSAALKAVAAVVGLGLGSLMWLERSPHMRSEPERVTTPSQVSEPAVPVAPAVAPPTDAESKPPVPAPPPAKKRAATPAAPNTEDAMYLHILDLLRADRKEPARGLARRYLKEFPNGFRRAEVMRIAEP